MFEKQVDGIPLRFHLAGINNQNFLMRDDQTGSFWQQITGLAIAGPLKGKRLRPVFADELSFALWRKEQPGGSVLDDVGHYAHDYSPPNWDVRMAKAPTVISYAQAGLKARDLMLGISTANASRAFPYQTLLKEKVIEDRVGGEPVILVLGSDNLSVRAFHARVPGQASAPQFYRVSANSDPKLLIDGSTGSEWSFAGCAQMGALKGTCLQAVPVIKDYWFDWRNSIPTLLCTA